MLSFNNDYMRGAHPEILKRLVDTNMVQTVGYGLDEYTAKAAEKILNLCDLPDGQVYFLIGGTQTNTVMIDAILTHCQGILATDDAHINVHEAGAIEATGHKVITLKSTNGKLDVDTVAEYVDNFYRDMTWPHMSIPGMVYISQPTEIGSLYSLEELTRLSKVCHDRNLPLYLDGARLIYALAADGNNVGLKDIARMCDAFYVGGTKAGTLFGEALVVKSPERYPHLFSLIKQHGALLAKGRLTALQFDAMFSNGLYDRIGNHAVMMAAKIKNLFLSKGWRPLIESTTNQQIFAIPNDALMEISKFATFDVWGSPGEIETVVRFTTDWSTQESDVEELTKRVKNI